MDLEADRKVPHQSSADAAALADDDQGQSADGRPAPVEYDVARVEKVYRKLDRRIIPGMVDMYTWYNWGLVLKLIFEQLSGSCTFSARPSAPTLAWPRR